MKPEILPPHTLLLFNAAVKRAAELLRAGEVVALPTETVYGLAANALDVARAEEARTPAALVDRLRLTADRIVAMADGLRDVAGLPDPVGEVVRGNTVPSGLELRQIRVPFGVMARLKFPHTSYWLLASPMPGRSCGCVATTWYASMKASCTVFQLVGRMRATWACL